MEKIELRILKEEEKEFFIKDIQAAFKKAAVEEFGDDEKEVIPREDVIRSFEEKGAESYFIFYENEYVGGTVLKINRETNINELQLLYINIEYHSKGIGTEAWRAIEELHPETKIWETCTPYFEKRNINFYVNKCGFHIVEFYNQYHKDPNETEEYADENPGNAGLDMMFRFEKIM
ncbi:MAG: GNAT family N-acetyltransferase [Ruminococcaceae bacterium]|nr:GNAT family N-acetyltransferase [Oscillospiraceae bacterium]